MQYLHFLAVLALAGALVWLIRYLGRAGDGAIDRMVHALTALIGGYRPDGWPIGVQEEDRDRPWGRSESVLPSPPSDEPVPVEPVRPVIRGRA